MLQKRNEQPFPGRRLYSAQNPFLELMIFDIMGLSRKIYRKKRL